MGLAMIYVASKALHGKKWQYFRDTLKYPISSTWIDESEPGSTKDMSELWMRCVEEVRNSRVLVVYRAPDEFLKGALVEVGAAIVEGIPVFAVGCGSHSWTEHPLVCRCSDVQDALDAAVSNLKQRGVL